MDDTLIQAHPGATTGYRFDYGTTSLLPNQFLVNGFKLKHKSVVDPYTPLHPTNSHTTCSGNSATSSSSTFELDSPDAHDFSNAVLKYINDMLMEEELENKNCLLEDCVALQAAEKSFYDVLGQKNPPLDQSPFFDQNICSKTQSGSLEEKQQAICIYS